MPFENKNNGNRTYFAWRSESKCGPVPKCESFEYERLKNWTVLKNLLKTLLTCRSTARNSKGKAESYKQHRLHLSLQLNDNLTRVIDIPNPWCLFNWLQLITNLWKPSVWFECRIFQLNLISFCCHFELCRIVGAKKRLQWSCFDLVTCIQQKLHTVDNDQLQRHSFATGGLFIGTI